MRKMSTTSVQVLSPWHILPKLKPCLACCVQLVPVVSSALSHQSQQPKALAKLWTGCFGSLPEMWSKALEHRALVCTAACTNPGMLGLFLFKVWPVFVLGYFCFGILIFLILFYCTLKDKLLPLIIFFKEMKTPLLRDEYYLVTLRD